MNRYILVIYDSKKRNYYNRIVSSTSKEMAIVEFMTLRQEGDVLLNIMNYD